MRSSTILLALGAALAVASPVHRALHEKKAIVIDTVTDIVTDIVYVTVTEDPFTQTDATTLVIEYNTLWVAPVAAASTTTTTSTPLPPPPPPTTSSTPPPAPTTTEPPPPPPPAATTTPVAPVAVPSSPAPVVQVAATTAAAPAAASPTDYISTALYHHNIHRANHSSPDITWSDTLAGYALITAQTCVFAHDL
jgi:uncharacterized protein YkwD